MKKFLLLWLIVGLSACSVDPIEDETLLLEASSAMAVAPNQDAGCAGPDNSTAITLSEAKNLGSWDEVRKMYTNLLPKTVSTKGTFNPTISKIIENFNKQGIGEYSTTYSVSTNECTDSVMLTLSVVEDPVCGQIAGEDNSTELQFSEAAAIESFTVVENIYLDLLSNGVSKDGTFEPTISSIIKDFNKRGVGEYTTLYTVVDGKCTDSALLTLNVIPDVIECKEFAGPDNSVTLAYSKAAALGSFDEVKKTYLNLLGADVPKNGTFNPMISTIINDFNKRGNGDYTTEYTVVDGDCTDSVLLTLSVVPDPVDEPVCGAIAGPDNSITMTYSQAAALGSWDEVRKVYIGLLAKGVAKTGTFDPSISRIITDFNSRGVGSYTTKYTVVEGKCSDSTLLTIVVVPDNR
jgi:hypothetical protein